MERALAKESGFHDAYDDCFQTALKLKIGRDYKSAPEKIAASKLVGIANPDQLGLVKHSLYFLNNKFRLDVEISASHNTFFVYSNRPGDLHGIPHANGPAVADDIFPLGTRGYVLSFFHTEFDYP